MSPGRAGTCILISLAETDLLLDCSPGGTQRISQAGHDARRVRHVFLTHHHWDHLTDLPVLVLGRWERSLWGSAAGDPLAPRLSIYGPKPTRRIVELLFGEDGVYGADICVGYR